MPLQERLVRGTRDLTTEQQDRTKCCSNACGVEVKEDQGASHCVLGNLFQYVRLTTVVEVCNLETWAGGKLGHTAAEHLRLGIDKTETHNSVRKMYMKHIPH